MTYHCCDNVHKGDLHTAYLTWTFCLVGVCLAVYDINKQTMRETDCYDLKFVRYLLSSHAQNICCLTSISGMTYTYYISLLQCLYSQYSCVHSHAPLTFVLLIPPTPSFSIPLSLPSLPLLSLEGESEGRDGEGGRE